MSHVQGEGRYVAVPRPRAATVDVRFPGPMRFHVRLTVSVLNHGMPAGGRWAPLRTRVARAPLPDGLATSVLRRLPTRRDHQLDDLRAAVLDSWDQLVEGSPRLQQLTATRGRPAYEDLSLLAVQRSGGRSVYVFVDAAEHPALVLAPVVAEGRRIEADAQRLAAELDLAPRPLGRVGDWLAQEGVPGLPLWLDSSPDAMTWPASTLRVVDQVHTALGRLSAGTVRPGHPSRVEQIFAAANAMSLDGATRRRVRAVHADLRRLDVQVLEHRDVSAQNLLVHEGTLTALVDWEFARRDGVVGIDHLNAALSLAEHARGRWAWSDAAALALLRDGWDHAAIFTDAREHLRRTLTEVTGSDRLAPQVEVLAMLNRVTAEHRSGASPRVGQPTMQRALRLVLES